MVCIRLKHKSLEYSYKIQHLRKVSQSFFSLVYGKYYIPVSGNLSDMSIVKLSIRPIKNINIIYREMERKIGEAWFRDWKLILLSSDDHISCYCKN